MGISGNTFVPPPHPTTLFGGSLDNTTKEEVVGERFAVRVYSYIEGKKMTNKKKT